MKPMCSMKLPCAVLFLFVLLSGCGGLKQVEGTNGPDRLHVVRPPVTGYNFARLDVMISDTSQVTNLYNAAYALKKVPQGAVFNCPSSNGLEYNLDFLRGSEIVQHMQLDANGCQFIDLNAGGYDLGGIVSTHDTRFTTPAFRGLLTKMLDIPSLSPSA